MSNENTCAPDSTQGRASPAPCSDGSQYASVAGYAGAILIHITFVTLYGQAGSNQTFHEGATRVLTTPLSREITHTQTYKV